MKICKVVLFVLIIFLGSNITGTQINDFKFEKEASKVIRGFETIFYVDDNADPNWYNDTNFKFIMDAVNNSGNGDTIVVYNGTYYENVTITKSINLIGENKNNTIIDGSYNQGNGEFGSSVIIIFMTEKTCVSGFTIQNVVTNNFVVDAGFFIGGNSKYIVISDNIIKNIVDAGILLKGSNQFIFENTIINSGMGIWCESSNSTITKNIITKIDFEGILLWGVDNNKIKLNNISFTNQGIFLEESNKNLIEKNNISNNKQSVFLSKSRRNRFFKNNFIGCGFAGHVKYNSWSFLNRWRRNYWDNQIICGLPKIIAGRVGVLPIPWFKFDIRPAKKPYEI